VAYRVKYAGRSGTHRIMTPVEFLARLAALVAPPRYPLVRYHGVVAPHSKWRSAVVPRSPPASHAHDHPVPPPCSTGAKGHTPASTETAPKQRRPNPQGNAAPQMSASSQQTSAASPKPPSAASAAPVPPAINGQLPDAPIPARYSAAGVAGIAHNDVEITDFGISVRHLDRLLGGLLLATSPRLDWATLLRRTYAVDVLACVRCGGRLRLLSAITERATAKKILDHLGLPVEPSGSRSRPWDPAELWVHAAAVE
jgi:hypothetical protein